jgi:hypothetical protein
MNRRRSLVLFPFGLAVLLAALPSRTVAASPPDPTTGPVEVRFTNGSIVVMTLLQETIEVQTEYGRLTVPHRDVRQIEFGVRTSEEERQKIDDALRRLANTSFKEREAAVQDLVRLGLQAYPRLRATKSDDPEVAQRVQAAAEQIREKVNSRLLRRTDDDIVRTAKFTIVGRVMTAVIKARAEEFGDLDLRPARLLSVRRLAGDDKKEVAVDAATYGGQGDVKWFDTGVRVETDMGLKVTAAGQVDLWPQQPGQYMAGPDGQKNGVVFGPGQFARQAGTGTTGGELLGRIGETGTPFVVGSRYTRTQREGGKLYLRMVPSPWGNPSTGEYRVAIIAGSFATDGDPDD